MAVMPDYFHNNDSPTENYGDWFNGWLKDNTSWEDCQKDLDNAMTYARRNGAKKFVTVGFCWGAWAVFHACQSKDFLGGASFHPSVVNIGNCFDPVETGSDLASKIVCPQLLCPTKDEDKSQGYHPSKEDNTIWNILNENFADKFQYFDYKDMDHGFMTRGDLSQEDVSRDVADGWKRLLAFFNRCVYGDEDSLDDDPTNDIPDPEDNLP